MQSQAEQEAASSETAQVSLLAQLSDSWHAVLSQISGAVDLAALEARLAALSLLEMLALAMTLAVLAITAWLLVLVLIALALMAAGLPLWLSVTVLLVTNLAACVWIVLRIRRKSADATFPATRSVFREYTQPQHDTAE